MPSTASTNAHVLAAFIERCRLAVAGGEPRAELVAAVADLLADRTTIEALTTPALDSGPITGHDETVFEGDELTVMLVHTRPGYDQPAHDHLVDAVIGVYDGGEVHRFYTRVDHTEGQPAIELAGTRTIRRGDDVLALTPSAVHAIAAADDAWTSAVHVYTGGLSGIDRSLFHPDTGVEEPLTSRRYVRYCRPHT